mgnify:FL=1
MPYPKCKIYSDGSHYIAIPHTTRPYKPRRKPKEEVITVSEESTELQEQAENSAPSLGDASIPLDEKNYEDRGAERFDSGCEKENTSVKKQNNERQMTRKELFEELYEKNINLSRRQRRKAVLNGMRLYFKSEEALQNYVTAQFERKLRNLIARRLRMTRKVNLQDFNFFVTLTYSDELHTEESFKAGVESCLRNFCNRRGWKYIGVWERSPKKKRLHFHGIFYIPEGTLPGKMLDVEDYNFNTRKRQVTHQNTYFNEKFGRSDFEPLDMQNIGSAIAYIVKYLEKTGEKLVYSKGLPQFFLSDIMDEDIVCPCGLEDKKLLLYDDFGCWDEGCYMGAVSKDVIRQMPKSN